ncbi:MAG: hypothetical protein ACRDH9_07650 [Actinomycetota bacterium]
MRVLRGLLLIAIGAAGAVAADRVLIDEVRPLSGSPPIERTEPRPGDPPLVWIGGSLEEIGNSQMTLVEGEGPKVVLERFAGDATRFFRPDGDEWRALDAAEVSAIDSGEQACIEALVDDQAFLAIRVFLERDCAPA